MHTLLIAAAAWIGLAIALAALFCWLMRVGHEPLDDNRTGTAHAACTAGGSTRRPAAVLSAASLGRCAVEGAAVRNCVAVEAAQEGIVTNLTDPFPARPLTREDGARLREALVVLGTLNDPTVRAAALMRVTIACVRLGIPLNQIMRQG